MAEVVGLISAIGSIAAASVKVAKLILEIADDLGTAGTQVRMLASDTQTISWVLTTLELRLKQAKSIPPTGLEVARTVTKSVQLEIEGIDEMLKPLLSPSGRRMTTNQKVKWIFTKSRIMTRQVAFDSLKGSLTLVLHALSFIEREDLDDRSKLLDEIELVQSKSPKIMFINAEQQDQALREKAETLGVRQTQHKKTPAWSSTKVRRDMRPFEYDDSESETWVDETENSMALATLSSFATKVDISTQKPSMELVLRMPDEQFMAIATHMDIQKQVLGFANAVIDQEQKDSLSGLPDQKRSSRTKVAYAEQSESEPGYYQESLASDSTAGHGKSAGRQAAGSRPYSIPSAPKSSFAPGFDGDSALATDDHGYPVFPDRLQITPARGVLNWLESVKTAGPASAFGSEDTRAESWDNDDNRERPLWRGTGEMPAPESASSTESEQRRLNISSSLRRIGQHLNPRPVHWVPRARSLRDGMTIPKVKHATPVDPNTFLQQWENEHPPYQAVPRHLNESYSPVKHQRSHMQPRSPVRRKQPSPEEGGAYLFSTEPVRKEAGNRLSAQSSFSDGSDDARNHPHLKLTRENVLAHVRLFGGLPGRWELVGSNEEEVASESGSRKAHISEQDEVKLLRGHPSLYL